jgi:polyphosphate glucokinase
MDFMNDPNSSIADASAAARPITLAIDIGGSGLKVMTLDADARPISERVRTETPVKPNPERVLEQLEKLRGQVPEFDRVSVGFPGVIKNGHTLTAANLHPEWIGFDIRHELESRWNKPVRVENDAAVQGYGAIRGEGVELIITLGIYARGWNWGIIRSARAKVMKTISDVGD